MNCWHSHRCTLLAHRDLAARIHVRNDAESGQTRTDAKHLAQASPAVSNMAASSASRAPAPAQATNWNAE